MAAQRVKTPAPQLRRERQRKSGSSKETGQDETKLRKWNVEDRKMEDGSEFSKKEKKVWLNGRRHLVMNGEEYLQDSHRIQNTEFYYNL